MSDPHSARRVADREATEWHVRLGERPVSAATLQAFAAWRATPRNAEAYRRVEALWKASGAMSADADVQTLTRDTLKATRPRPRTAQVRRLLPVIVGALLLLAGGAALSLWLPGRGVYATGVGEQRVVALEDGTRIRLDTDTRMRVLLNGSERRIILEYGQARFDVARDADRPFRVLAGATEVTALGTVFDVRRSSDGARVTLVEGVVAVTDATPGEAGAWTLRPGQRVRTDRADAAPEPIDAELANGWSEGRLVFRNAPLGEAVAEVNRYLPDKIVLPANAPREVAINGVFAAGDGEAFAAAVSDLFALDLRRATDRGRRTTAAPPAEE